jgi:hypothetical protein
MPLYYQNLNLALAQINGPRRVEFPFYRFADYNHVVITQPYAQLWENYVPIALNSEASYGADTCYMVGDVSLADIGAGVVGFDRQWANVPNDHFDFESLAVTYPGYFDGPANLYIRRSYAQTVMAQIQYEYFLTGSGETYESPSEIPIEEDTRVTDANGLNASILSGVDINNGDGEFAFATDPALSTYQGWVTTDGGSADTYSIVESCKVVQYLGGIWCRETRRVKAK